MILNCHNLFVIELHDPPSRIAGYCRQSYGWMSSTDAKDAPRVEISFPDDLKPKAAFRCCGRTFRDGDHVFWQAPNHALVEYPLLQLLEKQDRVSVMASPAIASDSLFHTFVCQILRYLLIRRGVAFMHASSFGWGSKVMVCPAWREVGKTGVLLLALQDGALYYGDDLALVSRDGTLYPWLSPLHIFDHHLRAFPHLWRHFTLGDRVAIAVRRVAGLADKALHDPLAVLANPLKALVSKTRFSLQIKAEDAFPLARGLWPAPVTHCCLLSAIAGQTPATLDPCEPAVVGHAQHYALKQEFAISREIEDEVAGLWHGEHVGPLRAELAEETRIIADAMRGVQCRQFMIPRGTHWDAQWSAMRSWLGCD